MDRTLFAAFPYDRGFPLCSLLFVSFVASRPTGPILQPQGQEGRSLSAAVRLCYALCALRFFAVTVTEHGHALDAKHSRTIENMELQSLLVYDMKN